MDTGPAGGPGRNDPAGDQRAEESIPRSIHLIWLGSEPDRALRGRVESFERLNPGWDVRLWRDDELEWLTNRELFDAAPTYAGRANIARYEILAKCGGYYFDADFEPVAPLTHPLIPHHGLVVARESQATVATGFFGAPAGHPFLLRLIERLPASVASRPGAKTQLVSGPQFFTGELTLWAAETGNHYTEAPRDCLYPYSYDKLDRSYGPWSPAVVAVHHWNQARDGLSPVGGQGKTSRGRRVTTLRSWTKESFRPIWSPARDRIRWEKQQYRRARWRPRSLSLDEHHALLVTAEGWPLVFRKSDNADLALLTSGGCGDPAFDRFLGRVLLGSDSYVEVGAGIGETVVRAARRLTAYGRVFAYEPDSDAARALVRNVELYRESAIHRGEVVVRTVPVTGAPWRAPGRAAGQDLLAAEAGHTAQLSPREGVPSDSRTVRTWLSTTPQASSAVDASSVSGVRLDEDLAPLSHVRLLRVNTGGTEAEVLAGAAELVGSGRVDLIDLTSTRSRQGARLEDLVALIADLQVRGATLHRLLPDGRTRPLPGRACDVLRHGDHAHLIVDLTGPFRRGTADRGSNPPAGE